MGFSVFRICMTILICLFLLTLFLVPSAYLDRFSLIQTEQADEGRTE